jgi:hypothetical protein
MAATLPLLTANSLVRPWMEIMEFLVTQIPSSKPEIQNNLKT